MPARPVFYTSYCANESILCSLTACFMESEYNRLKPLRGQEANIQRTFGTKIHDDSARQIFKRNT